MKVENNIATFWFLSFALQNYNSIQTTVFLNAKEMTPYRFYEYSRNQGLIGSRKVIKGPCETTFNMSSSSFKINFCCSSTFEVSSAILFSASSRRLVFSDILTFKNRTYQPVPEDKDALRERIA